MSDLHAADIGDSGDPFQLQGELAAGGAVTRQLTQCYHVQQ